ncbi:MAG TPA: pseudouridine-5'-phosphate glycosidase [Blastocatellia bacterium]|nr:pseudouridine-5'-phosphate glycosidase [Blastocatellia bacterium]
MVSIAPAVEAAVSARQGVVALESTVIAHGLPSPQNVETARDCESEVQRSGALPATIGIVAGRAVVGLDDQQIQSIAKGPGVAKVNLANLAHVIAEQGWGATTVAASLHMANLAGIKVFATGGVGGVHRGASDSFDVSADLPALARYPVITVCAGAKAILDLPKTMEVLETLGVPVIGYQTDELPAFYSRSSGLKLDLRADGAQQIAKTVLTHWRMGFSTGALVVAPVPHEDEVPANEIKDVIDEALEAAAREGVAGRGVTPFLLSRIAAKTGGRALRANVALLKNNARVAGAIAVALAGEESLNATMSDA